MRAYGSMPPLQGGVWAEVEDGERISYQIDPGSECVVFTFFGPMEVSLGMSVETIRRCQALFGSALDRHDSRPSTLEGAMVKGKHEPGRHEDDRDGHGELDATKFSKPKD